MHATSPLRTAALIACLLAPAIAAAQVQTAPLPQPDEPATRPDRSGRQTGMVTFDQAGGQQIIIRSFEPDSALTATYRIDFDALDSDGDGYISRKEAAAHPALAEEFKGVDSNGDGKLDRDELRGWMR